ncbi:MAG: trypsin-like peptidase domain-containing protein [Tetrasphaera sp.]
MVALAALTAALASGGTYAVMQADDDATATPPVTSSSASPNSPTTGASTISQVAPNAPNWTATAAAATPSVVAIKLQVQGGTAQGSGVVIDSAGHILTNNHVVDGADEGSIEVTLSDGRILAATVAGTDAATDLAVITLTDPPSGLKPIAFGDSDALKVGDPVMAVGNPLGLASTVTTGIVSALNRPVETQEQSGNFGQTSATQVVTNAIQTSAAINPGNSGGALVDGAGRLIGINSSIASTGSSGGNIGIGFAIPVNEARAIADQLIKTGKATHAYLGVNLDDGEAKDGSATLAGAQVSRVEPDTPAQQAGMRDGDVVVAVDGEPVESAISLIGHIREQTVGGTVTLTVIRDGQRQEISVTLAARPDN